MKKVLLVAIAVVIVFALCSCMTAETPATGTNTSAETEEPAEEPKEEKIVVEDNDDIYFAITGISHDSFYGDGIAVEMENKTDTAVMFAWEDTSCNGYMVDNYFSEEVQPGKKASSAVYFIEEDLEKNNIEKITEIEYTLWVWNTEDWADEDVYRETFVYKP